ncbi:MAG TPA: penicillin-binding protein 2 [Steroidobacteraceae bacterium]|nr:penicillin-binding protein 2 [Steroidobacteraceae bacterium]
MVRPVRIKDHHAELALFEQRAIAAAIIMVFALGAVIARLFYLQVIRYDYFAELSQGNRIKTEPIPPNRGLILDRNGLPLATNAPSYQLELTREQVGDLDATLKGLVALGLLDPDAIPALKKDIRGRRSFEAVPIKLQLSEEELARFAARRYDFPGVEIRPRLTRYYPLGPSGVHALGYVAAISEEDKKLINMDEYAGTTLTGKTGVEQKYEKELHGRTGFQQLLVNAQGRRVEKIGREAAKLERREPQAGNDLFLTIDLKVQEVAEEALRGQRAAVVAIDPNNGDIIAFVSTPAFDPNLFARGLTRKEYLALTEDPNRPMYDRALRGVYPPGSTVKPLFALAALEYGVVSPNDTRFCRGLWSYPGYGRARRDWKPGGHGTVDMRKAIATSCDVYFFDLARIMGIDRMASFLSEFGFGAPTGIDIDGERVGILPSTEWKRRAYKKKEYQVWFPGDTISVGIGQGQMLVTPVQLAHAIATLAAKGKNFQPRLVRAIRDVSTGQIHQIPPKQLPSVKVDDPAMWDIPQGGMYDVANAPYGTARGAAAGSLYKMAGKSGTAQVFTVAITERVRKAGELEERLRDHALFVAFAPFEAPKLAVAVVVENAPGGGSAFAAPIARRILDTYLLTPEQLAEQEAKRKATGTNAATPQSGGRE